MGCPDNSSCPVCAKFDALTPSPRVLRILAELRGGGALVARPGFFVVEEAVETLCRAAIIAAEHSGLTAVCVSRVLDTLPRLVVWASTARARKLDELQVLLGEGPAVTALADGAPVLVPDLHRPWGVSWQFFVREATLLGVGSVCAFPLQIGAAQLGVLTLHGQTRAQLDEALIGRQLAICDALTLALLSQADDSDGDGLDLGNLLGEQAEPPLAITSQAAGMVMVQLCTTIDQAMLRLCAHAFATGRSLADISRSVVNRELRFAADSGPGGDACAELEPN